MKLLKRLTAAPFIFCLLILAHSFYVIRRTYFFIRYGGELILHEKDESKTIQDIYREIKQQHEQKNIVP